MANVNFFSPDGGVTRYPIEDTEARSRIDNLVTGVSSFNGRSGSILPIAGDYDATQVNYSPGTSVKKKIDAVAGVWTTAVSCLVGDTSKTITNSAIHTTSFIKSFGQYDSASNYAGMPVPYKKIAVSEGSAVVDFGQALPAAASIVLQIIN